MVWLDVVELYLAVERRFLEAEKSSSLHLVSVGLLERSSNQVNLEAAHFVIVVDA